MVKLFFQTVAFDLSQTDIPENKRSWVIWVIKKKKNFTKVAKKTFL